MPGETQMKTYRRLIVWALLALASMSAGAAAPELGGTWQGKLQADPGNTLTIQFIFTKKSDGSYAAVLNSPDNGGIKNVAAAAVTWDQNSLKVQVPTLSGTYSGTLKGSSIEGQWTQEGQALPLVLSPFQKAKLSKAAIDTLSGAWHGPVTIPGGSLTFVARFKTDEHGELQGSLAVPEQGGQELKMSDIEFADGKLSFKIPVVAGELTANYVDGSLVGSWRQGPVTAPSIAVTLKRGDVAAPVFALKLTDVQFAPLSGSWEGALDVTTPQGTEIKLPLVLRFETDKEARHVAYLDSPSQGSKGIPVSEVTFADGKLLVKVAAVFAQYQAEVKGSKMVGQWTQGPGTNPLTLTRK
jgi:hypothetical protein